MLLEEAPGSMNRVRAREPHFQVFSELEEASYAKRYEILLTKLVRERLYMRLVFFCPMPGAEAGRVQGART